MPSFRRRNGRWQVQIRRKGYRPVSRTFDRKSDAIAWATETENFLNYSPKEDSEFLSNKLLFKDLLCRYSGDVSSKKRGAEAEIIRMNYFLRLPLADIPVSKLTPSVFAQYRDKRLQEVSPPTVRRELAILQNVFEVAHREWNVPIYRNPVKQIRMPDASRPRERRLTNEEEQELLRACGAARNGVPRISWTLGLGFTDCSR